MSSPDQAGVASRRHLGRSLALLAFAQLIVALDINIVYVALPQIGHEVGFTGQTLQWVISAYAVAFGGFLLLGGRSADLLGRRRIFMLGLSLYAISSLVGGLAPSPLILVAVRAVQGLGGALLFPATLALINTMFAEGRERNRALAAWSLAGAFGLSLGSLLGGVLTDLFGWEAVFYVNVPLAGIAAVLALPLIPRDQRRERGRTFDVPGALTVTAGVTLLVFALVQGPESGWASTPVLVSLVLSVLLLGGFAATESRSRDPLMPPWLIAHRSLRSAMAITFLFGVTYLSTPYFITVYFQDLRGYSTLQTGLAFLVPAVLIAIGTQIGERMSTRTGLRTTLITGNIIALAGTLALAWWMTAGSSYAVIAPGLVLWGVGQGIAWTAMWITAAAGVAPTAQGVASGMASTAMQMGTAVGLAVLVGIARSGIEGATGPVLQERLGDGVRLGLVVAAGLIVASIVVALTVRPSAGAAPTMIEQSDAEVSVGD